jgi:hypothetical protein
LLPFFCCNDTFCRDFSYSAGGGAKDEFHQHTMDYVFVNIGGPELGHGKTRLIGYNPDGSTQFDSCNHDGEVMFTFIPNGGLDANGNFIPEFVHSGENGYKNLPFTEYLVELK